MHFNCGKLSYVSCGLIAYWIFLPLTCMHSAPRLFIISIQQFSYFHQFHCFCYSIKSPCTGTGGSVIRINMYHCYHDKKRDDNCIEFQIYYQILLLNEPICANTSHHKNTCNTSCDIQVQYIVQKG